MHVLENFLFELQQAVKEGASKLQVEQWGRSPLLKEHELLQATYALLAQQSGLAVAPLHLKAAAGGAFPLFGRGFFPWKALPYPREHAQLGVCLARLDDSEAKQTAVEMARFQNATLDHTLKPAYSLFLQEGPPFREELDHANAAFFEAIGQAPAEQFRYSDPELALVARRTQTSTVICAGSGCKSGLGLFLHQDAGIINWGPQTTPIGTCEGFGLAGRAQKVRLEEAEHHFALSFQCRLAVPTARETGFSHLQDAGYSGQWMEATIEGDNEEMTCSASFHTLHPAHQIFTLFGKGRACYVAKSHKLNPSSLDRYHGPIQPVTIAGALGEVRVEAGGGVTHMEIIPLAGDNSFWGADFLIAYTLTGSPARFTLKKNT